MHRVTVVQVTDMGGGNDTPVLDEQRVGRLALLRRR